MLPLHFNTSEEMPSLLAAFLLDVDDETLKKLRYGIIRDFGLSVQDSVEVLYSTSQDELNNTAKCNMVKIIKTLRNS